MKIKYKYSFINPIDKKINLINTKSSLGSFSYVIKSLLKPLLLHLILLLENIVIILLYPLLLKSFCLELILCKTTPSVVVLKSIIFVFWVVFLVFLAVKIHYALWFILSFSLSGIMWFLRNKLKLDGWFWLWLWEIIAFCMWLDFLRVDFLDFYLLHLAIWWRIFLSQTCEKVRTVCHRLCGFVCLLCKVLFLFLIFFNRCSEKVCKHCISIMLSFLTLFNTHIQQVENIIRTASQRRSSSIFLMYHLWLSSLRLHWFFRCWCFIIALLAFAAFCSYIRIYTVFTIFLKDLCRRKLPIGSI